MLLLSYNVYFFVISEIIKAEKKAYEKVIRMMAHEINNSVGAVNSILDSFINCKEMYQLCGFAFIKFKHIDNQYMLNKINFKRDGYLYSSLYFWFLIWFKKG